MKCPKCGRKNPEDAKFCNECANPLRPFSETIQQDSTTGERKQATVLFSDLSGYTAMNENFDPEEVKKLMGRIFSEAGRIVEKYGGVVERFFGDEIMALFGVPKAHEDDPVRAVKAALELNQKITEISPEYEDRIGKPLSMHTGINTGLVVTGDEYIGKGRHGLTGGTINLAKRLTGLAKEGEIFIGSATYEQVAGFFSAEKQKPTALPGKSQPETVYKLLTVRSRPDIRHRIQGVRTDLIGRGLEMATLIESAERIHQGEGGVICVTGDAGTGKSRLILEFKSKLENGKTKWHEGHAYGYTRSMPYFLLVNMLSHAFQINEGDDPDIIIKKLESGVGALLGEGHTALSVICSLFSLNYQSPQVISPENWKSKLYDALHQILEAMKTRAPTIICFEDLHWADPSTIELLRKLLVDFSDSILFLCVHRPSMNLFDNNNPNLKINNLKKICLQNLDQSQSCLMLRSLLCTNFVPLDLITSVQNKVEGNPFYLEEIINSLIEGEVLIRENEAWTLTRKITDSDIPATIHGLLMSRIDRLDKPLKRILQEASVIGQSFNYKILKKITNYGSNIDQHLSELERLDLIRTKSGGTKPIYVFKHTLAQEVVYNGILKKQRKLLHGKIGDIIEKEYGDRIEEVYEIAAFHYDRSNSFGKAYDYLKLSGKKATKNYANWEAYKFYKGAIELLEKLPPRDHSVTEKVQTYLSFTVPVGFLSYPEDSLDVIKDGVKYAKKFEANSAIAKLERTLAHAYAIKGDSRLAIKHAENCFFGAQNSGSLNLIVPVARDLISTYMFAGSLLKAVPIFSAVIPLIEAANKRSEKFGMPSSVYTFICGISGFIQSILGSFEEAEILCQKAYSNAVETDDLYELSYSEFSFGIIAVQKGDGKAIVEHFGNCVRYLEQSQMTTLLDIALACLGLGYMLMGNMKRAKKLADRALSASYEPEAASGNALMTFSLLAIVFITVGEQEKALSCAKNAVKMSEKHVVGGWAGLSLYILGMVLAKLEKPKIEKAEGYIKRALPILREYQFEPELAKGTFELAEIYLNTGNIEKALKNYKIAETMFQKMEMNFWLIKTKAILSENFTGN